MYKTITLIITGIIGFIIFDTVCLDKITNKNVSNDVLRCELTKYFNDELESVMHISGISVKDNAYGDLHYFNVDGNQGDKIETIASDINELLQISIENFCEVDLLKLNLKDNKNESYTIEIRNCKVTVSHKEVIAHNISQWKINIPSIDWY